MSTSENYNNSNISLIQQELFNLYKSDKKNLENKFLNHTIKKIDNDVFVNCLIVGSSILKVEIEFYDLTIKLKILEQTNYYDNTRYILGNEHVEIYSEIYPKIIFKNTKYNQKLLLYIRGEESYNDTKICEYTFNNNKDLIKYITNLIYLIIQLNESSITAKPLKDNPKCPYCGSTNRTNIGTLTVYENNNDFVEFNCNVCYCKFELYK